MSKKNELMNTLNAKEVQERIKSLLEGDLKKAEKFRAALINVALDESLKGASVVSIVKSAFSLAEIGLPLNKNLGLSYILKYKRDAQPVISAKGWVYLAKKAGLDVKTAMIYGCDDYSLELAKNGWDMEFKHAPNFEERENDNTSWIKKNLIMIVVSTRDKEGVINHYPVGKRKIIQLAAQAKTQMVYNVWAEEMYTAKALKYVLSRIPMIPTLQDSKVGKKIATEKKPEIKIEKVEKVEEVDEPERIDFDEPERIEAPTFDLKKKVEDWQDTDEKTEFLKKKLESFGYKNGKDFIKEQTLKSQEAFFDELVSDYEKHLKALEKAKKKEEKAKKVLEDMSFNFKDEIKKFIEEEAFNNQVFIKKADFIGFQIGEKTEEELIGLMAKNLNIRSLKSFVKKLRLV